MGAGRDRGWATAGRSASHEHVRAQRLVRRRRLEVALWSAVALTVAVVAVFMVSARRTPGPERSWWAVAVGALLVMAIVRRPPADPDRWRRGAAGEVATAGLLDGLPGRRWAVLHDRRLPGSRANVDHLVIGRRGVWVLDSKAYRAPVRAGWRGVRVGDRRIDTSAVAWEASVVADRLGVEVRPIVVVHAGTGSRLGPRGRRCGGVRVLPADAVVRHLRRARGGVRLRRSDIAAVAERAASLLPEA